MNERAPAAAAADNEVADSLTGDDFQWGEDGANDGIVTDPAELTDDQISAEGQEDQPQTDKEGEDGDGEEGREEPAGQKPQVRTDPAGNQQQTPPPAATQPPASEQAPPQQRAPLFHEMVNANFDAAVDHVAGQGVFRLAPEDAEILEPEAVKLMEKQSAKVFLRTMSAVSEMLHTSLPQVVGSLIGVNTQARTYEDTFYKDHGFDRTKHHDTLVTIARNVLAMNPKIDRVSLMNQVAQHGHAMLGTKPPVNGGKNPQTAQAPQGSKVVKRQPFAPAGRAAGGNPAQRKSPGQKPAQTNPLFDLAAMLNPGVELDD